MRSVAIRGSLTAAVVLSLAACSSGAGSPGTGSADAAGAGAQVQGGSASDVGSDTYVFLPKSLNNPYWVDARKGMEAEAAKLGVKAQFLGPDTDDAGKQVEIFESVLAQKPAGIAVSPNDPASVINIVSQARAAGIPVISWDGPVPDSEVMGYIGTDNVAAGERQAEALVAAMGETGKIAIVTGSLSATNLVQRLDGLKKGLAAHPGIEIVATETSDESIAGAQSKAETLLQAHPDLTGMAGISGSDLPGIAGALKAAGKCGDIKAVGFDVVPQNITAMQEKCADAAIAQKPYGMTAQALDILKGLHEGNSDQPADFNVDTGVEVVTPANLDDYMATGPH
ncbi:sugar-binding protein [Modestobacter sp. L9-4]|uniref:sugar-binding protein n=1 Tax=Modestobacter sp. L9-4 TaxID=2851567 RepID=UPI001C77DBBB|nr:sugar-binding protein [Modestobacter sp. L9-4]QXG76705.1 sugar-binding protein [Modestobacter sp. L9-4]